MRFGIPIIEDLNRGHIEKEEVYKAVLGGGGVCCFDKKGDI